MQSSFRPLAHRLIVGEDHDLSRFAKRVAFEHYGPSAKRAPLAAFVKQPELVLEDVAVLQKLTILCPSRKVGEIGGMQKIVDHRAAHFLNVASAVPEDFCDLAV